MISNPVALLILVVWCRWIALAKAMPGLWVGLMVRRNATDELLPQKVLAGFSSISLDLPMLLALGPPVTEGWSVERRA